MQDMEWFKGGISDMKSEISDMKENILGIQEYLKEEVVFMLEEVVYLLRESHDTWIDLHFNLYYLTFANLLSHWFTFLS